MKFVTYGNSPLIQRRVTIHALHAQTLTVVTFPPNFRSTSVITSEKNECGRQTVNLKNLEWCSIYKPD